MIVNYVENVAFSPSYIADCFTKDKAKLINDVFQDNIINTNNFSDIGFSLFK